MVEDFFLCTQSASGRLPRTTIPPPIYLSAVLVGSICYCGYSYFGIVFFTHNDRHVDLVNEQEEEEEAEGKSLRDIWKSMSNPNFSHFGLYTSSLIILIACLASRYLIAPKKKKTEKANTKEKKKQHT